MERNSVAWFEIYVQDMEKARAFYQAVLQQELEKLDTPEPEMWTFPGGPEKPGAAGAIVKMEGVGSGGNSTLVYFSCLDCAQEASRVDQNGGKVIKPKFSIGQYGFIALASDPDGNMFGLHSMT